MPVRVVGGGQVAVQDLLDPERRDRDVQALLDLERELARGDLVDAAAGDDQALAAGERRARPRRTRSRRASVPSITRVHVVCVGGAGDRGQREQRRDVADGVAPRRVHERRADDEVGAGLDLGLGRDQDRARAVRGRCIAASVAAVPASCEIAISTPLGLRVERGLERVAGARAVEQRRAGHRRVLARAAADDDDRARPRGSTRPPRPPRARPGSAPRARARPGSSPPWPTAGRRAARACRSWPSTVPSRWPFRQGHFDADEPSHFGAVRRARPRRGRRRCAPSSRTRSAPRSPAAARRRARGCRPRACSPRRCTSRAAWSARRTRRSPPRAGSRSAAAPRRSSAPCRAAPAHGRRARATVARSGAPARGST